MSQKSKKETIVIIGFGWVGQANALALAKMGYDVFYYDKGNPEQHYKEEYGELYGEVGRLEGPLEKDSPNTWYILCVGDVVPESGPQDIERIKLAAKSLSSARGKIILRSTVIPDRLNEIRFDIYLPEFLHEKLAVEECINPHFFAVGEKDASLQEPSFLSLWANRSYKIFRGTPYEASLIKYLSNIWNAVRIAFVNEFGDAIGNPSNREGVKSIERVVDFVLEKKPYVRYGKSFSGHCLPKDMRAFIEAYGSVGKDIPLLRSAYESNKKHEIIQNKYDTLPEWYSFWERGGAQTTNIFIILWSSLNNFPPIKFTRRHLRFLVDMANALVTDRTMADVGNIWELRARKNSFYFSNMNTRSRESVDEAELRVTGKSDYTRYILDDDILKEHLENFEKKNMHVLEIGSGVGRMTEHFAKDFGTVYAIDISKAMLDAAKDRIGESPTIRFVHVKDVRLPFPENHFDFIFSYLVHQYIPTIRLLEHSLSEIRRSLTESGIAKIQLRTGRGPYKWKWYYGISLTPEKARALAERAGLRVIQHEVEGGKNLWVWVKK